MNWKPPLEEFVCQGGRLQPSSVTTNYIYLSTFLHNLYIVLPRIRSKSYTCMEANMDIVYLAYIVIFFTLMVGLAVGCAKLGSPK